MYLWAILSSLFCLLFISNVISDTNEPKILFQTPTIIDDSFESVEDFPIDHFVRRAPSAFLRFGRQPTPIGTPLASASFLRFGRAAAPSTFLRFGRGNTNAAGFLRFGRQNPSTGSNAFLRFGRRSEV